MAYTKQEWTDNDATTPITGDRLDYIEEGIRLAHVRADASIQLSTRGVAGGVATLDANGDVPLTQLQNVPQPVLDHGGLTGLGDDDHANYLTTARLATNLAALNYLLRKVDATSVSTARPTWAGSVVWVCTYVPFSKPTAALNGDQVLDASAT